MKVSKIAKNSKTRAAGEMVKIAVFDILKSAKLISRKIRPKLISRKIRVTEKVLNFYTVFIQSINSRIFFREFLKKEAEHLGIL